MPANDESLKGNEPAPQEAERKLWLDYLAKLNDREIQSARASGFTTWALLAVAAAIVYRSVPQLPRFLSTANALKESAVIFLLEANAVLFFAVGFSLLVYYCAGETETRLYSEIGRRVFRVEFWTLLLMMLGLAIVHFAVATELASFDFVWWTLVGLGTFWGANIAFDIQRWVRIAAEAKKHKIPVPLFSSVLVSPHKPAVVLAVIMIAIGTIPMAALLMYLKALSAGSRDWVMPLGSATQVLVLLVISLVFFFRGLATPSRNVHKQLERDILLERLGPDEIRSRFISQVLGDDVAKWLKELGEQMRQSMRKTKELAAILQSGLEEIEGIDSTYSLERRGRANCLLKNLRSEMAEQLRVLIAVVLQLREFSRIHSTAKEIQVVEHFIDQLRGEAEDLKAEGEKLGQLRKKLEAIAEARQTEVGTANQQS